MLFAMTFVKRLYVRFAVLGLIAGLIGCQSKPVEPNDETVVTMGSAATVQIFAYGDIESSHPAHVALKSSSTGAPVVQTDFASKAQPGETLQSFEWRAIAAAPDSYLSMTAETSVDELKDVNFATGSGFVISENGYIVTCQHVIDGGDLPNELTLPVASSYFQDLEGVIGAPPSDLSEQAIGALITYFQKGVHTKSVFKLARILLPNHLQDPRGFDALTKDDTDDSDPVKKLLAANAPSLDQRLRAWTKPAVVIRKGEEWPGKDVAILKVDAHDLLTIDVSKKSLVEPGSMVFCLGFPDKALLHGLMTRSAEHKVILHSGRVGQTLPMKAGFEAIHTEAEINHGDSGGPGIDSSGAVVGLNVGGHPDAAGQNYLVPASVIRERMHDATLDDLTVDPINQLWREGLGDLQAKRYSDAKAKFQKVLEKQRANDANHQKMSPDLGDIAMKPTSENQYVLNALKICEDGLKGK